MASCGLNVHQAVRLRALLMHCTTMCHRNGPCSMEGSTTTAHSPTRGPGTALRGLNSHHQLRPAPDLATAWLRTCVATSYSSEVSRPRAFPSTIPGHGTVPSGLRSLLKWRLLLALRPVSPTTHPVDRPSYSAAPRLSSSTTHGNGTATPGLRALPQALRHQEVRRWRSILHEATSFSSPE